MSFSPLVCDCLRYMQEGSDFLKVRSYARQFRRLIGFFVAFGWQRDDDGYDTLDVVLFDEEWTAGRWFSSMSSSVFGMSPFMINRGELHWTSGKLYVWILSIQAFARLRFLFERFHSKEEKLSMCKHSCLFLLREGNQY